ncbi:Tripartite tricarboxylate transporter family receptor [Pigmentiphaga humi]|uniref:Tripartite tricarboxylate transporter family receptor n=1 Tax=Pigmentiphaga humi TaxID=2478468 RepID=A0A3P4B5Z4_9BURK|nr:tripartite tricarboxylate transporter substrate binding protein [Pigmentiphaga humi]VCU71040.1 Tripartite tricarboxylate transporter family receptor [Pigmentiphaga humi]
MKNRRSQATVGALALAFAAAAPASEEWPSRPLRIIVSQSAGGQGDLFLRALSKPLSEQLGQPVIIENRTGGNGVIAANACKTARPDGYTLCAFYSDPIVSNPALFKDLQYDPNTDFRPVMPVFFSTLVLGTNPSLGVKTVKELVEFSKRNPGTLNYAAPSYSVSITFMERLKRETGASMTYIPYRGGGEVTLSILSGTTPVGIISLANLTSYIKDGKIVPLAVDSAKRAPLLPNVPTMAESGVGFEHSRPFRTWFGLFAPAATPDLPVDRVHASVRRVLQDPTFIHDVLVPNGLEDIDYTPAAFAAYIKDDQVRAKETFAAAGVQAQ